ncbi:MAG: efflux RND transporter periplasmic adaptor subunit [Dechloromonas sp.]|jgi:RND family efflux transporter MFP subunit|nr:MAG: efflux RND transporter periplasmic adaptor subunit [Dechloromonas sp.]
MTRNHRLTALLVSLFIGAAHAADPLSLHEPQIRALGIETATVGEADQQRSGVYPARVLVPNEQMRVVAAPVAGMLEMLAVAPGATVKRGQVLARLASPQALELQRDALQAGSQSALLRQSLKRDEQLFAEGLIAESRLQATRAAASQAAAQASERQQGLALAGIAPGKLGASLALTAPIDGVVLEQGGQLGQRVEAATLIYRVARLTPLWLEIQVPLGVAATLKEGMPIKLAERDISGRLIAIGRAVDPASQTVLLRAEVNQGAAALHAGQVLEVEIATPAGTQQQRLPAAALVRHDGKTYTFVQRSSDEQGTSFAARPVRVVSQGGDSVLVEGVQAGERVAVKGVSGLKALLAGVGSD